MPERRSNSLVIYARKQEVETIARLVEKLDADIYGGQRVFFYFAENTKAQGSGRHARCHLRTRDRGSTSTTSTTTPTTGPAGPTTTGAPGLPSQSSIAAPRTPLSEAPEVRGPSFLEEGALAR